MGGLFNDVSSDLKRGEPRRLLISSLRRRGDNVSAKIKTILLILKIKE